MKAFDHAVAETPAGIAAAVAKGYAIRAGGIDIVDRLKERTEEREKFVSIGRVKEFRGIRETDTDIVIGALTTLREIAASDLLRRHAEVLAQACGSAATPQVRAVATLGGNLMQRPRCWYFRLAEFNCLKKGGSTCFAVDGENEFHSLFESGACHIVHPSNAAPPLVALGATIVLNKADGTQRTIEAKYLIVLPTKNIMMESGVGSDEFISEVRIPKGVLASAWNDVKQRQSFDWPLAACAVVRRETGWSVVLGAVAPTPRQAEEAEKLLANATDIDDALATKAAEAAIIGAKPMSRNAWRLDLVRASVRRALLTACKRDY